MWAIFILTKILWDTPIEFINIQLHKRHIIEHNSYASLQQIFQVEETKNNPHVIDVLH